MDEPVMKRAPAARPIVALLVLAVCGCGNVALRPARVEPQRTVAARPLCREHGAGARPDRTACDKEWSVLVYMMADAPGLPAPALWNLHQMEGRLPETMASAASGRDADIVVELDVEQPPGIRRLQVLGGLSAFVPLRSLADYAAPAAAIPQSPIVESLDEARAEAPPATPMSSLVDFLSWGIAHYPARHYVVIVWGHGFGFRPAGVDDRCCEAQTPRGGIALDVSRHTVIDTPALRAALAEVSTAYLAGRPFDLYLSDACLMQTIEVGAELAGVVRYIGGAEAKLPLLGLPYRLILPLLNGSAPPPPASPRCPPQDPVCRFAVLVPELVRRGFDPQSGLYASGDITAEDRDHLTYSVLDARLLADRVVPAMHALGLALLAYLREAPYQQDRTLALRDLLLPHRPSAVRPAFVYAFPGGGRDIGSFLVMLRARLASTADRTTPAAASLLRAVEATEAALRSTVLASVLGPRYDDRAYAGMLGVSVWLPIDADDYKANGGWFAAARFYQAPEGAPKLASPWGAWLQELFAPSPTPGETP
jgi:hypothetical protein